MNQKRPPDPLPPFPYELEHLWRLFSVISRRRQSGMATNPILPSELKTLSEQLLVPIGAWEASVIYRLDDAVLGAWAGDVKPPKAAAPDEPPEAIPGENGKGLKALFRGLAAKKARK